jgi:hypothetical protein
MEALLHYLPGWIGMNLRGQAVLLFSFLLSFACFAQEAQRSSIAIISDTQAPMWIEKVFLKSDRNEEATSDLFSEIVKLRPGSLFILGDVTAWSAKKKKWRAMDKYVSACRASNIKVTALLGNHDVMGCARKGVANFKKRFPELVTTGYCQTIDSIAFVLLNSNFKKLKPEEIENQQNWYNRTLDSLDKNRGIKVIVVSCHHAPYSNSKIVGSSHLVQKNFVPDFVLTKKCRLFITGHSHAFEHFIESGKDFFVIGGGGGIHQPLSQERKDIQADYKPEFHFLMITPESKSLQIESIALKADFSGFEKKHIMDLPVR